MKFEEKMDWLGVAFCSVLIITIVVSYWTGQIRLSENTSNDTTTLIGG